jgi:hypothetical protein
MSAKDVVLTVIISLLVAELGPWCGWLAGKLVLWGAALRYGDGDRAAVRAVEWSEDLCEIPGQLSKLAYSLGQLLMGSTVAARRKIKTRNRKRIPVLPPDRVQAKAGVAGATAEAAGAAVLRGSGTLAGTSVTKSAAYGSFM